MKRLTRRGREEAPAGPATPTVTFVTFVVQAGPDTPITVQFEPQGTEFELAPGDHLVVQWPVPAKGQLLGVSRTNRTG
ncbi:hypothetical protein ACFWTC_14855 [Streptomyces sp. NPDC058619]|uniref:hypothetical protein n=1 Tax=unclassified Streptomyces TaxID=2593676 RepID=UPI003669A3CF